MAAGILFEKQSIASYVIGLLFGSYVVYYNLLHVRKPQEYRVIYYYVFFLLILVLFSSELVYSLKIYLKAIIPFLFYPISQSIVKNRQHLKRLNKSMLILLLLYLLNLILANYFHLGGMSYENEDTLDVGNIYKTGLNSMAYILVLMPLLLKVNYSERKTVIIIYYILGVIVFVTMIIFIKRGAILSVLSGYFIFVLLYSKAKKRKIIANTILIVLLLWISYPLYGELFEQRFQARESRFLENSMETEGRYLETFIVIDEVLTLDQPLKALFGHELFNSPGNYYGGRWGNRQLHNDYANLLNGSGLVGIFLFFYVNYIIQKQFLRARSKINNGTTIHLEYDRLFTSTYYAVFGMYFFMSLSGGIDGIFYSSIRFIYLGAISGIYLNLTTANQVQSKGLMSS